MLALTVITGIVVLIFFAKVIDWILKRGRLGVVLWANSTGQRWMAVAIILMGLLDVADGIYSRDYRRLIAGSLFVSIGFSLIFPLGRLRVCEKGIETGFLVLHWAQISGWAWGPGSESRSRPASLGIEGSGERQLYLWTSSRWRLFYDPRPGRPVKTTVPFDDRLNVLLEEQLGGTTTCH